MKNGQISKIPNNCQNRRNRQNQKIAKKSQKSLKLNNKISQKSQKSNTSNKPNHLLFLDIAETLLRNNWEIPDFFDRFE